MTLTFYLWATLTENFMKKIDQERVYKAVCWTG